MKYLIYDKECIILRTIEGSPAMASIQVKKGEFIMEGDANDATQKIEFDGFDVNGQPINPRVVDKTPEEIERVISNPPKPIPIEKQPKLITNEQWQDFLDRLEKLETKA